jgi:hypothetical protein
MNKLEKDKHERKQFVLDSDLKVHYKSFLIDDPTDDIDMFCVKCEEPVIACCGDIVHNYIRHRRGTKNGCKYYELNSPSEKTNNESEDAIELGTIRHLLNDKNLQVQQRCIDCDIVTPYIFEDKDYDVRTNYTYLKDDGLKTKSDVVLLYEGKVCFTFELCFGISYKTDYDKPNTAKWFKLYKPDIMEIHEVKGQINEHNILNCCRKYRCNDCDIKAVEEINKQKRITQDLALEKIKQIEIELELERERKKKDTETCPCGRYRKPPFKVCFKCNQANKKGKCITCSKSIDIKYSKCYSCGDKDKKDLFWMQPKFLFSA